MKVSSLKELVKTDGAKLTYAVIRGANNTIITVRNKNGRIYFNVFTIVNAGGKTIASSNINIYKLDRVIDALTQLYQELKELGVMKERRSTKVF